MSETISKARLWIALPTAIVVGILNVFLFFLFMVLYSYVIDPGHNEQFYQEAAGRFGPVSSIICGIPLMYLAGRWIGKRVGAMFAIKAALLVWLIYFTLDVAIVGASGALMSVLHLVIVSFTTKLAAIYMGARHSAKN